MTQPFASICIITYNQADFMHETLTSALEQDYDNLEVVVADDGSTDGTVDVILEYARKYPKRLVPLVSGPHLGITGNSNRALRACNGKYVAFMGGDDILLSGKIQKQVEWLEENERHIICYHDIEVFDSSTGRVLYRFSERHPMRVGTAATVVRHGTFMGGTSVMVRASSIPPWGFDERVKIASDWLLWIDCLARNSGYIGYIDGVYAKYRRHDRNVTSSRVHGLGDALVTLAIVEARYPSLIRACRKRRADLFFIEGMRAWLQGERGLALKYLKESLVTSNFLWSSPMIALKGMRFKQKHRINTGRGSE